MTRHLRAGLIGLGAMGRHHARILGSLEGVSLVAAASLDGDIHNAISGLEIGGNVEHLIRTGVDYVVVAVPTAFHVEIGLQLAEAGIAALIEKPLAATLEGASQLAVAFADRGIAGAVGHIERYNPAVRELRRRLLAGDLGTIFQVATRRQGPFPARIADVGVIKDLATHDIDLTSWITGQPYEWVAARVVTKSGRPHEDMVAVTGQLADGTITSHLVNWLSPLKERTTVVTGEAGAFVADTLTADLTFFANGTARTEWSRIADFRGVSEGDVTRYAILKPEPLRAEHEQFRDYLIGRPADIVTLEEGVQVVAVAEAIAMSARSGQGVSMTTPAHV